jgi:hypothetical protein
LNEKFVIGMGFALVNEQFNPNRPYSCCLICGAVYQTVRDVQAISPEDHVEALMNRRAWNLRHSRNHTGKEHAQLKLSGRTFTPEAARVLAAYGIISVSDMVMCDEHEDALRNSPNKQMREVETKSVL